MLRILFEWITPVLRRVWLPVAGVFGAYLLYAKGKQDQRKDQKVEDLQEDLEVIKRIQNVKVNTDRDAAIERLQRNGDLRD